MERLRSYALRDCYDDIVHPFVRPAPEGDHPQRLGVDFSDSPYRISDGTQLCSVVFPDGDDYVHRPLFISLDGRAFSSDELPSLEDCIGVARHAVEYSEELHRYWDERGSFTDELYHAYEKAVETDEGFTGEAAREFNKYFDSWSRALDFSKDAAISAYSGLRYLRMRDSDGVYVEVFAVRRADGEAVGMSDLENEDLRKIVEDLLFTLK